MNFSKRTFADFIAESAGRDTNDGKYGFSGSVKAKRLRAFWVQEPNHRVGKLVRDLLEYCRPAAGVPDRGRRFEKCERIARRLQQSATVEALESVGAEEAERAFEVLARAARSRLDAFEPEAHLDRLQPYVTKLICTLSEKRGVVLDNDTQFHSIFGENATGLRAVRQKNLR